MANKDYDTSLDFKLHNRVFNSLSEEIDYLGRVMIELKIEPEGAFIYIEFITSLYIRYSAYLQDESQIFKRINEIKNKLSNKEYLYRVQFIKAKKQQMPDDVSTFNSRVINNISLILRDMIRDFVESELLPKPKIIKKAASEREIDPKKKAELRAVEFLEMW